jgi:hypothetical protein
MWSERYTLANNNTSLPVKRYIPYREVFANKRMRFFLSIVILLWIAVGAQALAHRLFFRESDIMSAFVTTNSGLMESTLEVTAEYGSQYLTVEDKESLISYIAAGLGILVDSDIKTYENEKRQEMVFQKQAARATTTIKVVTIGNRESTDAFKQSSEATGQVTQYIMVRIVIYEDANNDVLQFKDTVERIFKDLDIQDYKVSTTLQLCGAFEGNLLLDTKNKLADDMISSLDGKIVFENRKDELYTIYAYTGLLKEYITVENAKINIQVAMSYDEENNCTKIYLATPIISGDW